MNLGDQGLKLYSMVVWLIPSKTNPYSVLFAEGKEEFAGLEWSFCI